MSEQQRPVYRWRRTWPDRDNDFSAKDGDRDVGRVYAMTDGERWQWFLHHGGTERAQVTCQGVSPSARAAALACEAQYLRLRSIEEGLAT